MLARFWLSVESRVEPRHRAGRLKQWLNYLRRRHPEAQTLYDDWRTINDPAVLRERLQGLTGQRFPPLPKKTTARDRTAEAVGHWPQAELAELSE